MRKPQLRRRPSHSASFGAQLSPRKRVRCAESVTADNWPMIAPEIKTPLNATISQVNGGRGQQKVHLRLLLGSRREIQARRVGNARPVHILSARKTNSYKNSASYASFSASFVANQTTMDTPRLRSDARHCNPRNECSHQQQTRACRHHDTPGEPHANQRKCLCNPQQKF